MGTEFDISDYSAFFERLETGELAFHVLVVLFFLRILNRILVHDSLPEPWLNPFYEGPMDSLAALKSQKW